MNYKPSISIIIPIFNAEKFVEKCISSILNQQSGNYIYEIIIIDDCSTDKTIDIIKKFENKIKIYSTHKNSGPGVARNIGIEKSSYDWILFLDADDSLKDNALYKLSKSIIENPSSDAITYNWEYDLSSKNQIDRVGRYDFESFKSTKEDLINDFISWRMDGSVIYTLMSKKLIQSNKITFREGYHEDVDFLFKVYFNAKNIFIYDEILYSKTNHQDSIVNNISKKHINGFLDAYGEIFKFLQNKNKFDKDVSYNFYIGFIGVIVTRVREIWVNGNSSNKFGLYNYLYTSLKKFEKDFLLEESMPKLNTRYFLIYKYFLSIFEENKSENLVKDIENYLLENFQKNWSCYDLHNSLFLGPEEIRTCCKRFFDEGKMKGDVVLTKNDFTIENILNQKKRIFSEINQGKSEECNNCPFLEFKKWDKINDLKIEHMSIEYHSVCNMKCIYCSDTYYGNKKPIYDIELFIDDIVNNNSLKECKSIVWGGGEPTLDKSFNLLFNKINNKFKNVKQKVITNSTIFIEDLYTAISNNEITITTSIDAGTPENFSQIRNSNKFFQVLENLKKYSFKCPENVTIKYILMEENSSIEELDSFIHYIQRYKLEKNKFQISFNFKINKIDSKYISLAIYLYSKLKEIGTSLIFLDDLFLQRIKIESEKTYIEIFQSLEKLHCDDLLFDYKKFPEIIIWGAGNTTKDLLNNSFALKQTKVLYLVDNNQEKIGNFLLNHEIKDPSSLLKDDTPVYIAGYENYFKIYNQYIKLGLDIKNIIKGIIL